MSDSRCGANSGPNNAMTSQNTMITRPTSAEGVSRVRETAPSSAGFSVVTLIVDA